jgi:mRNA-degrading endonuclease RelE of RelBE toxin-antitoxin system
MNLANGWQMFRVQPLPKFERSAKVLKKGFKSKRQQQQFVDAVTELIRALVQEPRHPDSRLEPIPKGVEVPEGWEFRKLVFDVPGSAGAAGEGRLVYLVNDRDGLIKLLWLYTHEEFKGRPPDKDLKQVLQEGLEEDTE